MASYITVDSGSTNTRVTLVVDGGIKDSVKFKLDLSDIQSRKARLSLKLKDAISEILRRNQMQPQQIACIIACGMITSEFGLVNLDHLNAPCGIRELAQNLYNVTIREISEIPFFFVRGVKWLSNDHMDMMRGEETEIYGISEKPQAKSLYVLPGSHSKLIYVDENHRISHFSTELTGELISAVANHTILADIIDLSQTEIDPEFLQKGFLYSNTEGMNAALFKVRSLSKFSNCSKAELFSWFIGTVLAPEINNIIKSPAEKIFVGGKNQLKEPTAILIRRNSTKGVEIIPEEVADYATAYGCVRIYEESRAVN